LLAEVDVSLGGSLRLLLEAMQHVHAVAEGCNVEDSMGFVRIAYSYFSASRTDRRHRLPIEWVIALLDDVKLITDTLTSTCGKSRRSSIEPPTNTISFIRPSIQKFICPADMGGLAQQGNVQQLLAKNRLLFGAPVVNARIGSDDDRTIRANGGPRVWNAWAVLSDDDMISAGYLAIRIGARGVLSACGCIAEVAPLTSWTTHWRTEAVSFGLAEARLDHAQAWLGERQATVRPFHLAQTTEVPTDFIRAFDESGSAMVIGVSLHRRFVDEVIGDALDSGPTYGLYEHLSELAPIASGGEALGYELLSTGYGGFDHSWHCYDLPAHVLPQEQVTLTSQGLLQSADVAAGALDHVRQIPNSPPDGEWHPFLLTAYPS
jgi:hypothetical protein